MKKIYCLFPLLILFCISCEEQIQLPSDGTDMVMIVNGSLCSADTVHVLSLSASSVKEGMVVPPDAVVRMFVNGMQCCESSEFREKMYYEGLIHEYTLEGSFAPGDKVRIVVESSIGTCEIVQTAPPAPSVVGVSEGDEELLSYYEYGNMERRTFEKMYLTVKDPEGKGDVYRVKARVRSDLVLERSVSRGGSVYPPSSTEQIEIFNLLEPVLRLPFSPLEAVNDFNIFCDDTFDGSQYTLTLCLNWKNHFARPTISGYTNDEGVNVSEIWVRHNELTLTVESLPQASYRYYIAVEYDTNNNTIPMAYEPSVFPSNVRGGLGYVNVSSGIELSLPLRDIWYDWDHIGGTGQPLL